MLAVLLPLLVAPPLASAEPFWVDGEPGPSPGRSESLAELAEALAPSVVLVQVQKTGPDALPAMPGLRGMPPIDATGSGFVISADGYIATNHHVVEGASEVSIRLLDGTELPAVVVGMDPPTDFALLEVEPEQPLTPARLGDSDAAKVGEWVVAIGNPLGFEHSVTAGVLTGRGRSLAQSKYDDFLQTDARIYPGNSGGPLVDTAGRVIGINSAIKVARSSYGGTAWGGVPTGIGFAIPINLVKTLLPQLRSRGRVTRGWIGASIQPLTPPLARGLGVAEARGALVNAVAAEGPASRSLEVGDVILEFEGTRIERPADLTRRVAETPPGTDVEMVVLREGRTERVRALVSHGPAENVARAAERADESAGARAPASPEAWGLRLEPVRLSLLGQLFRAQTSRGVRVAAVAADSPAARGQPFGLREGDIILEANRQRVAEPDDLTAALAGPAVLLYVEREDGAFFTRLAREAP